MAGFDNAVASLREAETELVRQLASVRAAISSLAGDVPRRARPTQKRSPGRPKGAGTKRRRRRKFTMSAEARARIAAAQRARWAKVRAQKRGWP